MEGGDAVATAQMRARMGRCSKEGARVAQRGWRPAVVVVVFGVGGGRERWKKGIREEREGVCVRACVFFFF